MRAALQLLAAIFIYAMGPNVVVRHLVLALVGAVNDYAHACLGGQGGPQSVAVVMPTLELDLMQMLGMGLGCRRSLRLVHLEALGCS